MVVSVVCTIAPILMGVINLMTYRTHKPEKVASIDQIRSSERDLRSIFRPAVVALLTGLVVSLASSFFFSGLTTATVEHLYFGLIFFFCSIATLVLVLWPTLGRKSRFKDLLSSPPADLDCSEIGNQENEAGKESTYKSRRATRNLRIGTHQCCLRMALKKRLSRQTCR